MDAKEGEDHEQKKVLHVDFVVIIRLNILDIMRAVHSGLATVHEGINEIAIIFAQHSICNLTRIPHLYY
jgi:hypothetical protein